MTHEVRFSPDALDDLLRLRQYVATEAEAAVAAAFVDDIVAYAEGSSIFPQRGRRRDVIRPGLRIIWFRRRVSLGFMIGPEIAHSRNILRRPRPRSGSAKRRHRTVLGMSTSPVRVCLPPEIVTVDLSSKRAA